jgi:riboflavin biosynthesis pyrimidine reductase
MNFFEFITLWVSKKFKPAGTRKYRPCRIGKVTPLLLLRWPDLAQLLHKLRVEYKVRTLACEGGPTLFRALLERGLADQLNLTIARYLFGGANAPTLIGLSKDFLPASVYCSLTRIRVVGSECFLTYRIKRRPKL